MDRLPTNTGSGGLTQRQQYFDTDDHVVSTDVIFFNVRKGYRDKNSYVYDQSERTDDS